MLMAAGKQLPGMPANAGVQRDLVPGCAGMTRLAVALPSESALFVKPASAGVFGLGCFRFRTLRGLTQVTQGIVLRDHLTDRLDIGARGVGRKVSPADRLGVAE